jgi:NitT/TauT family transport system permease protein
MAWIATGVKTALPYSLVAATTGEMLASRSGLGNALMAAGQQFDMPLLYSALIVLTAIGYAVSIIASSFERWMMRWRNAHEQS